MGYKKKLETVARNYPELTLAQIYVLNKIAEDEADYDDFGYKMDTNRSIAEPYGCGNMEFIPNEPTQEILDKYQITEAEYKEICDRLVEELSYHKCGLCV